MPQIELLFLDVTDKTRIGTAYFDMSAPSAIPCAGDFATVLDIGEPGKVAFVKIKWRHFMYSQSDHERLAFVQLWCERQH